MSIHEQIRELRISKDLSQRKLADILGVTQQAVGSWEKGISPNKKVLLHLAQFFDVTTDYLLGNTLINKESYELLTLKEEISFLQSMKEDLFKNGDFEQIRKNAETIGNLIQLIKSIQV